MKENKKTLSPVHKGFLALVTFIIFGSIGAVIRLFISPVTLSSNLYEVALQFVPFIIGFGGVSALLSYIFPRTFGFLLTFLSFFSIGS